MLCSRYWGMSLREFVGDEGVGVMARGFWAEKGDGGVEMKRGWKRVSG